MPVVPSSSSASVSAAVTSMASLSTSIGIGCSAIISCITDQLRLTVADESSVGSDVAETMQESQSKRASAVSTYCVTVSSTVWTSTRRAEIASLSAIPPASRRRPESPEAALRFCAKACTSMPRAWTSPDSAAASSSSSASFAIDALTGGW